MYTQSRAEDDPKPTVNADTQGNRSTDWYVLRVRARCEKLVAAALRQKQYEEYLPLGHKRSRIPAPNRDERAKSGRGEAVPLFPGYVFFRALLTGKPMLLTTPGVLDILRFGDTPAVVSEKEIEALKTVAASEVHAKPWPYLREGQRVRVKTGSLKGAEGILISVKNCHRIVFSVDVLGRSVAVEIDSNAVVPA